MLTDSVALEQSYLLHNRSMKPTKFMACLKSFEISMSVSFVCLCCLNELFNIKH